VTTIRIVHRDELACMAVLGKEGEAYAMTEVDPSHDPSVPKVRNMHPGGDDELQLFEATLPPSTEAESHAHLTDEIIYVVEGELVLGARTLGPGDSVFIGAETLYAFKAGPNGLRYLNFRGRRDDSHLSKEQLMARRAGQKEASASAT
jgi:quercetin dioxygenase-like cupin family protein